MKPTHIILGLTYPLLMLAHTASAQTVPKDNFDPAFDSLAFSYQWNDTMNFHRTDGELDTSRFVLAGFLHHPMQLGGSDWYFLPAVDYSLTEVSFNKAPRKLAMQDQTLHKLGMHAAFYHNSPSSSWIYGAWSRFDVATDNQHLTGDAIYFDTAIGAAYKVNDRLLVGIGVAGLELGSDSYVMPGPLIYWKPNDQLDVSLLGVLFDATYRPDENWAFAARVRPYGNNWNVDNNGRSQQLDISAYTLHMYVERRIFNELWISLGAGYTFGDSVELRDGANNSIFKDDLEGAFSASVSLRLRSW